MCLIAAPLRPMTRPDDLRRNFCHCVYVSHSLTPPPTALTYPVAPDLISVLSSPASLILSS
eukprot:6276913-Prymnesium_polylepis.1